MDDNIEIIGTELVFCFRPHPNYERIVPRMPDKARKALALSIVKYGYKAHRPIEVTSDFIILDGHVRVEIVRDIAVEKKTDESARVPFVVVESDLRRQKDYRFNSDMKVHMISVSRLKEHPQYREILTTEPSQRYKDRLADSLAARGFNSYNPIEISCWGNKILDGHIRIELCREMGIEEVPCIFIRAKDERLYLVENMLAKRPPR